MASNKDNNYLVVYCSCLHHAFVMVIDRTKSWEEVISDKRNGAIKIIDSSHVMLSQTKKSTMSDSQKKFFNVCTYFNEHSYQEKGTCWFNAMAAFSILLQEKEKASEKEEVFTIECINKGFEKGLETLSDFEQKIVFYLINNYFMLTPVGVKQEEKPEKAVIIKNLPVKNYFLEYIINKLRFEIAENRFNTIQEKFSLGFGKPETTPETGEQTKQKLLKTYQYLCNIGEVLELDITKPQQPCLVSL